MTKIQRIAQRAQKLLGSVFALDDPRALSILRGPVTYTGKVVTPESSLQTIAVWACVKLQSETPAALPLHVYRDVDEAVKKRSSDHWLQRLLDRPNPEMSGMDFRVAMNVGLETWGQAFARKVRNPDGETIALWPMPHGSVTVKRRERGGDLFYQYSHDGRSDDFTADEVFHVRGLSLDGINGLSPIAQARQAVGLTQATEEYGARFFGNGAKPSVVLEVPTKINAEARKQILESWAEHHEGLEHSHSVALAEGGTKIQTVGIPPEDAQFLETRGFNDEQIARLFGVPPHMIGLVAKTTSWGTGIEQMSIGYVVYSLSPRLKYWEDAISRSLLTEKDRKNRIFARHEVKGLLRGDIKSRYDAYNQALLSGWMNRNEVRALEELPPFDGGELYLVQSQNIPVDQAGKQLQGGPNAPPQPTQ